MSINAPEWLRPQYENRVAHIYQNRGNKLRPTVTAATSFSGSDKAVFYLAGKSKAVEKTRNQQLKPSNGPRKKFEASLKTWVVFDTLEQFDIDRLTLNEREVIYESGAMALGRATDIEIYRALAAAKPSADVDYSSGAFGAVSALDLCSRLQNQKVPWDGQVFCGLPSLQWNQLLANKLFNSADHVGPNNLPFVGATDTRYWNGVNWFLIVEEDAQDLFPVPGANKQDLFIWHKSAIGWGRHTDLRMIPQWHNEWDYWSFNMQTLGVAIALQEGNGIVRFTTSTNSTIAVV